MKKENKKEVKRIFDIFMNMLMYCGLLMISGCNVVIFSNVWFKLQNSVTILQVVGNLLIFGILFFMYINKMNELKNGGICNKTKKQ